jgi:hypothetical protein
VFLVSDEPNDIPKNDVQQNTSVFQVLLKNVVKAIRFLGGAPPVLPPSPPPAFKDEKSKSLTPSTATQLNINIFNEANAIRLDSTPPLNVEAQSSFQQNGTLRFEKHQIEAQKLIESIREISHKRLHGDPAPPVSKPKELTPKPK